MVTIAERTETHKMLEYLSEKAYLSLPPPTPKRYFERGQTLFESCHFFEAMDAYTECLKLDPSNMNAMYHRGIAKGILGDKEGSLSDLSLVVMQRGTQGLPYFLTRTEGSQVSTKDPSTLQLITLDPELTNAQSDLEEINESLQETLRVLSEVHPFLSKDVDRDESRYVGNTEIVNGRIMKVRLYLPHETLSHVQGLENVKKVLWNNVVLPMKRSDLFTKYKKKRSFAVILYGPPGCGKTLLVRALAGETGAHVVLAKLHELIDTYVGNTEKNIHAIFQEAREVAQVHAENCIIFLDELDAIGVSRGLVSKENSSSHRDAVNQLLMELDGIEKNPEGLFVMAATNRPWDVDVALKRSGRFGECIYINPPSHKDRKCLFEYYIGRCTMGEMDFERLAFLTEGFSAADIEEIVDKAKLQPILREHNSGVGSSLLMTDLETVLVDPLAGKGTLKDWYLSVANELSREPLDAIRYKPMIDDIKKMLQKNNSALSINPCT